MNKPVIQLRGVSRSYGSGGAAITVLRNVDLSIHKGEMIAIMGPSGSGKSTLMNILGCLDKPTAGNYLIYGRVTSTLDADELAELRREHFGFIFQRYHLLSELTALGNVEVPAIYSGHNLEARRSRATALLDRLGMGERLTHRPGELSGGQQQRVSIARALINGADVILADEPTGALDTRTGEEMLDILAELNADGHTIVIVTHDMAVARRAQRIVEIFDGKIEADYSSKPDAVSHVVVQDVAIRPNTTALSSLAAIDRFGEALRMAFIAMNAHRLRTVLTMLGIIIGIASVVAIVALGTGTQRQVLASISQLGSNTIEIFPGKDFGDIRSGKVETLVLSDAEALAWQPYAAGVTPTSTKQATIRVGPIEASALVNGVGADYFFIRNTGLAEGRFFDAQRLAEIGQDVVIDNNTRTTLFPDQSESPLGRVIMIGNVPCRIVGVTEAQTSGFGASDKLNVYLPFTTVQARFLGSSALRSILLKVDDSIDTALAEEATTEFLSQRHGGKDFFVLNTDDIRKTITTTTEALTLLVAAIGVISLIVGGIGVMNIMLVSVSERVQEIGVRMAVGARRSDILLQFLTEAAVVCFTGGALGVAAAMGIGAIVSFLTDKLSFVYSPLSIAWAFGVSTAIGIVFGFLPARNASRLDPAIVLSRG